MDMKKILQAMDGADTAKPKADDDMKRFVSIVNESKDRTTNRLTTAESMAVNHYTKKKAAPAPQPKESLVGKYFKSVEEEIAQQEEVLAEARQEKISRLAERAIEEVGGNYGHQSTMKSYVSKSRNPPDSIRSAAKKAAKKFEEADEVDTITMDVPLFLRLLEYAKEDAQTDMDLHHVTEKAIEFSKEGPMSMDQYDAIVGDQKALPDNSDNELGNM